jgi:hypothetical protein
MSLHCRSVVALPRSLSVHLGSSPLCVGRKKPFALRSLRKLARRCLALLRHKFVRTLQFNINNNNYNNDNYNNNNNINNSNNSHNCRSQMSM